jgi:hypothetical protein
MPPAESTPPAHRPCQRAKRDGGSHAAARNRAQQEARRRNGAARPGPAARAAQGGEGPVDEELARAAIFEHRTINREQHDVGRRDIERHAKHAFERQEVFADDTLQPIAAMVEWLGHVWPIKGIQQKADGYRRQDPACGTPRGFEHQHN